MSGEHLQRLYNHLAAIEQWQPMTLRPKALSTNRYDDVARLIRNERGSLLDVGCGSALFLLAVAGQFDRLVGIDLSPVHVERGRQVLREHYPQHAGRIEFVTADADSPFPFPGDSFDVVVACAIIEHVVDIFFVVDELARVCRPGGCVVVTVPNLAYIKHVLNLLCSRAPMTGIHTRDMKVWREQGWDGGHLHYFTKAALGDLLRSAGLHPEAWTGDGRLARLRRWYCNFVGNLTVRARKAG